MSSVTIRQSCPLSTSAIFESAARDSTAPVGFDGLFSTTARVRDVLKGRFKLLAAIALQAPKHLTREALGVNANRNARLSGDIAEDHRDVLPFDTVDEYGKNVHPKQAVLRRQIARRSPGHLLIQRPDHPKVGDVHLNAPLRQLERSECAGLLL